MEFCEPALFKHEQFVKNCSILSLRETGVSSGQPQHYNTGQTGRYILNNGLIILDFEEKKIVSHKAMF